MTITWKLPFSVHTAHERVYVIDAEYKRLTEITPGQFSGYVPSVADYNAIGDEIVKLLNIYALYGSSELITNE